ncbi:response regulator transcription factor [Arthrobacter rhizosphaerae]|uniref:response regulator transcription factor n=1 Tax=Arthrobacter rhizosphaerae TaxID=2855490 RepID=UPI001FF6F3B7|nr:response regulator transcription factor [Arthrobacter rhizosphaerae]
MEERGIAVVVEDDDDIRDSLSEVLQQSGFMVHATSTGIAGVEAVRQHNPTVVTVDLGLPDFDGIEASRRIRTFSDAYLIIVMGRLDEADALLSFEAGADDYLTTPFRPRELRARIAAMLRRPRRFHPPQPAVPGLPAPSLPLRPEPLPAGCFEHNGLIVDEGRRTAKVDGRAVSLTRTQFDLLLAIMEGGRLVQTRADLVRRVRNQTAAASFVSVADEHAIEVHMGNLRKQLADDFRAPRWVETVRGIGYRLGRAR